MKLNIIEAMKFKSGEGIIARSGGRGCISSLNIMILNQGAQALRMERRGEAPAEGPTLDAHADVTGEVEGVDTDAQRTADQGGEEPREKPSVVAGRLKLIRDAIDATLIANAAQVPVVLGGKTVEVPEPFHIGQPIKESMAFLCSSVQEVDKARITNEAEALGIPEDAVRKALQNRPMQRRQFMHRNREEILDWVNSQAAADKDGNMLNLEQAEMAFDALDPITKVNIAAAFDRGLFREWERQIQLHADGDIEAKSNIGLINGVRLQVRETIDGWMDDASFARSIKAATERGARAPRLAPAPIQPKPMLHERALKAA